MAAKPSVLCCHLANTNEDSGGLARAIFAFCKISLIPVIFIIPVRDRQTDGRTDDREPSCDCLDGRVIDS